MCKTKLPQVQMSQMFNKQYTTMLRRTYTYNNCMVENLVSPLVSDQKSSTLTVPTTKTTMQSYKLALMDTDWSRLHKDNGKHATLPTAHPGQKDHFIPVLLSSFGTKCFISYNTNCLHTQKIPEAFFEANNSEKCGTCWGSL